ncbi:uncharacterized protein EDB93DRAFT_1153388, partial [Suillus bovinus]|uniref:uncharacterized protein n=1 Tax=Suillus bovinus TaxID=48563 RepID=UPI001B86CEDD
RQAHILALVALFIMTHFTTVVAGAWHVSFDRQGIPVVKREIVVVVVTWVALRALYCTLGATG